MTDSPLDETAFAALVRDATDEDLPALACARGADDAWRVARSGLLLTSYTDDGGARKWAYRYAALRVGDGGARELAVFASAASRAVESAAALRLGEKTARPFSLPESGRWGGGGFAVQCAAGEPERFWRAVDEGDAAAWRAALNGARSPAAAGAAVHGGPLLCWRVGDADASWRERYCELRRDGEASLRSYRHGPAGGGSWRDHEVHALGDLAAVHLRRRDDLETPGFELADGGGRLLLRAPPDDSGAAASWLALLAPRCASDLRDADAAAAAAAADDAAHAARAAAAPPTVAAATASASRVALAAGGAVAAAAGAGAGLTVALAAGTLVGAAGAAVGRSPTHTAAYIATLARSYSKADAPAPAPPPPDLPKIPPVDDGDVVAEVDVDVRRARLVRSGGADDALPPTLKIDGDADGDDDGSDDEGGRLLEAPVVVVARLGDAVAASRVVARSSQLGRLRLSATFRATSARDRLLLELRAQSSSADPAGGALLGRRTLSLYELAERDADRRLAAVKETMDGALRFLAGAEPAPPAPSDSDSDDDPASHASFHRFARPAARAAEARTGAGWYALLADEDAAAAGEEEVEGGSAFVDGATDDASGLRRGNVAALVEARVAVSRRAPAAFLDAARRAKDRPPRDDAPSPAATVELLKRLFVVVAWVQGLVSAVDRLLRWDDAAASGGALAVCLAACLLWARDHFLALPVLLCACGLGALGLQRLDGDWARRRLGEAADRGPRARGDVAVLRVALLGVDGLEPYAGGDARPRVRLKYVPAPTLAPVAAAAAAAASDVCAAVRAPEGAPGAGDLLADARRACRDAGDAAAASVAGRGALRCVDVGVAALEPVADVAGDGRRLVRSWAWDRLAEVEAPRRDATAAPEAAAFALKPRLSTSAPPRVGLRSRAVYEAERLVQWATGRPSPVAPPAARTPGPAPDDDRDAPEAAAPPEPRTPPPPAAAPAAAATPAAADDAPAAPEPTAADLATVARRRARASSVAEAPPDGDRAYRRRWRRGGAAYDRAWAVPVLRELRRDAGGGDGARPARVAWAKSAGRLRVELYAPRRAAPGDDGSRRRDARQQLFARTFRDRASPAYYPHRMAPALSRGAPSAGSLRSLGALLRGEGDGEDDGGDCFGLSPTRDPDATLLGVAEVPLGAVAAAGGDDGLPGFLEPGGWLPLRPPRDALLPGAADSAPRADARDDVSDDDGGYASADGDEAPAAAPRAQLRCRLELLGDAAARRAFRDLDAREAELEVACDEAPPGDDAEAPGDGDAGAVAGTGLLSRFRRARHGAVEIQNSLKDAVRLGEQARGLLEWSQPAFTLLVFGALVLALAVAASVRADVLGVLATLGTFGPGLADRLQRRARRVARATAARRAAARCDAAADALVAAAARADAADAAAAADGEGAGDAADGEGAGDGAAPPAPGDGGLAAALRRAACCARAGARAARRADADADAASAAAVAAAGRGGARPPSQPATVWQRLLALLEALPCEPELEQLFSQRRKARDWRRDRRSAARRLGAAWAGPLWRRSTAWRRHFAAVRGPELQFWYSAQHALSGVTPVLVVSLGDARLVDDALASDNLPVLTLHAPLKSKPDVHREWRLAAAHHRDARALQRCICDRADDSRAAAAADAPAAAPPPEVKKGL